MRRSLLIMVLLFSAAAHAVTIEAPLPNAQQESAAQRVIQQLRCVVCEGQALADSDATFAREMRAEIRRMAADGTSAENILAYFRSRYGRDIFLTPPIEQTTLPLWLGPLVFILIGGAILWRLFRRKVAS